MTNLEQLELILRRIRAAPSPPRNVMELLDSIIGELVKTNNAARVTE